MLTANEIEEILSVSRFGSLHGLIRKYLYLNHLAKTNKKKLVARSEAKGNVRIKLNKLTVEPFTDDQFEAYLRQHETLDPNRTKY